jgi:peptidoglycan/LPS O-acetylase OafA/YrhL
MDAGTRLRAALLSATACGARSPHQVKRKRSGNMRGIVKLLVALSLAAALAGCVVAPLGPPRPYVAAAVVVPAPVLVVHGGYYWHH